MAPPIAHIILALGLYVFITTAQSRKVSILGSVTTLKVKLGSCPMKLDSPWCGRVEPRRECKTDGDCRRGLKCCRSRCGTRCIRVLQVTTLKVKLGSCPMKLDSPWCGRVELRRECETDGDCRGGLKCCRFRCGIRCVRVLQDKRGSCPSYNTSACALQAPHPTDECHQDLQCPGSERCCCSDCVRKCTATVKPGECPPKPPCDPHVPANECQTDDNCPGLQKCCDVCGMKCGDPTKERAGFCPVSASCVAPPDKPLCTRDIDCPPREKCCLSMNRMECMEPMTEYV